MWDFAIFVGAALALVLITVLLTVFPVMWLWNWLMPLLFHLPVIDAWQALGLSLLCNLLFKGASGSNSSSRRTK